MPRIARIVGEGYPHHIIQRGNNKEPIFFDDKDRAKYLYLLEKYSGECRCSIFSYCLMNNHVHILSVPDTELALSKMMQKLSLTYTQFINQRYNRTGRLWECRYYSALVDEERYLMAVVRYIEQNPVRAKIVSKVIEYPWSSAHLTIYGKKSFVKSIYERYGINKEEYARLLARNLDETEVGIIRKSTLIGKPIGSESFLERIATTFGVDLRSKPRGRPCKNGK